LEIVETGWYDNKPPKRTAEDLTDAREEAGASLGRKCLKTVIVTGHNVRISGTGPLTFKINCGAFPVSAGVAVMRNNLPKVTEPDENKVHYASPAGLDCVTLCGLTDFLESTQGQCTEGEVTCWHCKRVVGHILSHKKPVGHSAW